MKRIKFAKSFLLPDQVLECYRAKFTGIARDKFVLVTKDTSSVFQIKLNVPITLLAFEILHSTLDVPSSMKSVIDPKQQNDDSKGACTFVSLFSIKRLVSGVCLRIPLRCTFESSFNSFSLLLFS